jgi:hypothetical protein
MEAGNTFSGIFAAAHTLKTKIPAELNSKWSL